MLKLITYAAETVVGKAAEKIAEAVGVPRSGQIAVKATAEFVTRKVISKFS
ncbi:MAG TPA: hypothetical protein VGF48_05170 [Thermoanaerobaculia bacterium]|jgi:hypothetical protein